MCAPGDASRTTMPAAEAPVAGRRVSGETHVIRMPREVARFWPVAQVEGAVATVPTRLPSALLH